MKEIYRPYARFCQVWETRERLVFKHSIYLLSERRLSFSKSLLFSCIVWCHFEESSVQLVFQKIARICVACSLLASSLYLRNLFCIHTDRAIDALSYNIKTKVLVLRTTEIWEMKIEHMQNASVLWRYDIGKISRFPPPLHSFILSIKRCSARFIPSSYGINTLGRQNEQLYFIWNSVKLWLS
jgi:hypothetical protein